MLDTNTNRGKTHREGYVNRGKGTRAFRGCPEMASPYTLVPQQKKKSAQWKTPLLEDSCRKGRGGEKERLGIPEGRKSPNP